MFDAVIGVAEPTDLIERNARAHQVERHGRDEPRGARDFVAHDQGFAQIEADMAQRRAVHVDVVGAREDRENLAVGVGLGRGQGLAFEILGRGDRAAAEHHAVLQQVSGHEERGDGVGLVLRREADHRVEIREADLVGAARDAVDRVDRARTAIDLHVEVFLGENAALDAVDEHRLRAPEIDVQGEAHARARLGEGGSGEADLRRGGRTGCGDTERTAGKLRSHGDFAVRFRGLGDDPVSGTLVSKRKANRPRANASISWG
jgi:hypothetical protein